MDNSLCFGTKRMISHHSPQTQKMDMQNTCGSTSNYIDCLYACMSVKEGMSSHGDAGVIHPCIPSLLPMAALDQVCLSLHLIYYKPGATLPERKMNRHSSRGPRMPSFTLGWKKAPWLGWAGTCIPRSTPTTAASIHICRLFSVLFHSALYDLELISGSPSGMPSSEGSAASKNPQPDWAIR